MGGSGGGSGGSGAISYPEYLQTRHQNYLDELWDTVIPEMIANNPFIDKDAFDPSADLTLAWDAVCEFDAFVDGLSHEGDWESAALRATQVIDGDIVNSSYIDADIAAFADVIDDDFNTNVLPRFKAGMRDVNAVMSSAFVLGEADLYTKRSHEIVKYGTDLRQKLHLQRNDMIIRSADRILQNLIQTAELEGKVANISVDAKRIAIVAQKEEVDTNLEIDDSEARWDMETWQYYGNAIAAISGGVASAKGSKPSKAQSALSGALSGAATGMAIPGVGPLVGGLIGGVGGLLFS